MTKIRSNLQEIFDQVKAHNPTMCESYHGNAVSEYTADDTFSPLGDVHRARDEKSRRARAISARRLRRSVINLPDGIHPNSAGQRVLAENVWRVLEPFARRRPAAPASNVQ